jgi:molybdenum cofactor sulfurtransferase
MSLTSSAESNWLKLSCGEDGTINFASLGAVTRGLNVLSRYIPYLPLRLSTLTHHLVGSLMEIKHDVTCTPVARVLSRMPGQRPSALDEQSDTGSTVSLIFLEVSQVDPPLGNL